MFCPLCQAEYRDGFSTCSDCHLFLVPTILEARAKNTQLWEGEDQKRLDDILAILDEAAIPCHYKEGMNAAPRIKLFSVAPLRPRFKFQVWVFKDDLDRAQAAISHDDEE